MNIKKLINLHIAIQPPHSAYLVQHNTNFQDKVLQIVIEKLNSS